MVSYDNMTNCLYVGHYPDYYGDPEDECFLDCFNLSTGLHKKKILNSEGGNPLKDYEYSMATALTVYNNVYYFHVICVSETEVQNFVLKYDAKSESPEFEKINVTLDDRFGENSYNFVNSTIVQDGKVYLITASLEYIYLDGSQETGKPIYKGYNYRGILSYPLDFDAAKREVILGDKNVQHEEIITADRDGSHACIKKIRQKKNPSDKEFVSPNYFVAVKPKKLVVKDSGFLWVDTNDVNFYRTVTEVDLESLTLSIHDSNWVGTPSETEIYRYGFSSFQ